MNEIIRLFLDAGAGGQFLNKRDCFGSTSLHSAARNLFILYDGDENNRSSYEQFFVQLLSNGADPNASDHVGRTPLHFVVMNSKNACLLKLFQRFGADMNAKNNMLQTPLYEYCVRLSNTQEELDSGETLSFIQNLVEFGCDINSQAIDQTTVLMFASAKLSSSICELLIQLCADVHATDYLKRTALHLAARNMANGRSIAQVLIKNGTNVESQDNYGYTAAHYACMFNNQDVLEVLLEHATNLEAKGNSLITPIHFAAECGDKRMIEFLVSLPTERANFNVRDEWQATPLHFAACDGMIETIEVLVKADICDKSLYDHKGRLPAWHAELMDRMQALQLLKVNGGEIEFSWRDQLPHSVIDNNFVDEMEKHYSSVFKTLAVLGDADQISTIIRHTPGLGHVASDGSEDESQEILLAIENYVSIMLQRISQLDHRFQSKIILTGSSYESVKVGYPNEFDLMCSLSNFSPLVDELEQCNEQGFVRIKTKSDEGIFNEFIDQESRCLLSSRILRLFHQLIIRATFDIAKLIDPRLTMGLTLSDELESSFDSTFFMSHLPTNHLTWRSSDYKFLTISVDITPTIYVTQAYPANARSNCFILGQDLDLKSRGVYLIPKQSKQVPRSTIPFDLTHGHKNDTVWRLSFSHIEREIMSHIPDQLKHGYCLAKSFRLAHLSCQLSLRNKITVLDPADRQRHLAKQEEAGSWHASSRRTRRVGCCSIRTTSTTADFSVFSSVDVSDDAFMDGFESLIYDGTNAIHSYHLKNIFLKLMSSHCRSPDDLLSPPKMALLLYKQLLECDKQGQINSYFLPEQNLYYYSFYSDDSVKYMNMTKTYCERILDTMKKLGF
ncbi:unnamed protein product [Didymodactylos carnosus]|uniref:Mab-21-like nucleotidyltransferase domain-containing protein n=1 Tax=Didymodactylos carnosus TaxID=1234261 RepID=A0A815JDV1_9BILA|nr:unnamed protein product [Didymodactylos carnosus]CAF1377824.1 unnamed protein product [Didymodactylos carnosus]CAF4144130.1 unnamed protein product [Didymodactylos carnosus]CAF4269904.1 unnamed protein product [Didymodactylos carnosus]